MKPNTSPTQGPSSLTCVEAAPLTNLVKQLHVELNELSAQLDFLYEKISPILGSDFPVDPAGSPSPSASSKFSCILHDLGQRIQMLRQGVSHIRSRCET